MKCPRIEDRPKIHSRYIIISETEIIDFDLLKGVSSYIEYIFNVYVCLRFELLAINMEKSRDSLSPLGSMFSQDDVRFQSFSVSLLRFFSPFFFSLISASLRVTTHVCSLYLYTGYNIKKTRPGHSLAVSFDLIRPLLLLETL